MPTEVITVIISIIMAVLAFAGFAWKFSKDVRAEVSATVIDIDKKSSDGRARIYQRFDEDKKKNEEKFVRVDMCKVIQEGNQRSMQMIQATFSDLKADMAANFSDLRKELVDIAKAVKNHGNG